MNVYFRFYYIIYIYMYITQAAQVYTYIVLGLIGFRDILWENMDESGEICRCQRRDSWHLTVTRLRLGFLVSFRRRWDEINEWQGDVGGLAYGNYSLVN